MQVESKFTDEMCVVCMDMTFLGGIGIDMFEVALDRAA
jgi:hypothetical protein